MGRFWEIVFCVPLVFSPPCLSVYFKTRALTRVTADCPQNCVQTKHSFPSTEMSDMSVLTCLQILYCTVTLYCTVLTCLQIFRRRGSSAHIDVQLVFSWAPKPAKSVRVNIGYPVVRTDGPSLARCTVTWLPNFLGWVDYHISLAMGLRPRAREYAQLIDHVNN